MYIKFAIIILCFLFSLLSARENQGGRKHLVVFTCILLVIQSGFRHIAVGPDTYQYFNGYFEPIQSMSWHEVFRNFIDVYQYGEGKDAGFTLFVKIFQVFSTDYQVFLIFVAIVFFVPFCRFVYYNTTSKMDIVLAVIVYEALFYSFFSITGLRQTLATSMCLLSVPYIKERRLIPFLILMAVAFVFHRSSMVFLPFYWIGEVKNSRNVLYIALAAFPILVGLGSRFTMQLAILSGSEQYMNYAELTTTGAYSFLAFYFAITISSYYIASKNEIATNCLLFNAIAMGVFFSPLTFNSAALMRIVQYFSLFLVVLFPYVFSHTAISREKWVVYLKWAFICLLLYKIAVSPGAYAWMWEDIPAGVILE